MFTTSLIFTYQLVPRLAAMETEHCAWATVDQTLRPRLLGLCLRNIRTVGPELRYGLVSLQLCLIIIGEVISFARARDRLSNSHILD